MSLKHPMCCPALPHDVHSMHRFEHIHVHKKTVVYHVDATHTYIHLYTREEDVQWLDAAHIHTVDLHFANKTGNRIASEGEYK